MSVYRVREDGTDEWLGELHLLEAGRHWFVTVKGTETLFEGLPPFVADMSPQGYIGRTFSARCPELELPLHLWEWNDDHCLVALARRGEDCVGDLILGKESFDRWRWNSVVPVCPSDYPELVQRAAHGHSVPLAGGEQPKFLAFSEGRHVLVKFAGDDGAAGQRWRDLLLCEALALEAVRAAGLEAAVARCFDEGAHRFLEVERFDRIGERGRRGLLSLGAIDNEYVGDGGPWRRLAPKLQQSGRLSEEDARRVRWLDVFGQLIGNTDRHLGNLSFFAEPDDESLRLAPLYDMLPMVFAPSGTTVIERRFEPDPPTAETLDVWPDAARHAQAYWERLADCAELTEDFRARVKQCRDTLAALLARFRSGA